MAKAKLRRVWLWTAASVLMWAGDPAFADPPGRVGRLGYVEGTVLFHPANETEWSPATLNFPVVSGNSFRTEAGSRAEIQIGTTDVRLDEATQIDVVRLDDEATRFRLNQGVANINVQTLPPGGVQVETARGEVSLLQSGSYHIDAGQPEDGEPADVGVAVLEGKARIATARAALEVDAGEAVEIGGEPPTFTMAEAKPTPFDDWALARERREGVSESAQHVAPEVPGYRDLDDHGQWRAVPNYGQVWVPNAVAAGWAPYRYGHWAYVQPWGWTWIDDAPWGFAPFHYGRWVYVEDRWAWWPGVRVARPVYAPALVTFIGYGPRVGWCPLAPYEVFRPYYRSSPAYVRRVNVTTVNQTVINNINVVKVHETTLARHAHRGAATIVDASTFAKSAPVHRAAVSLPREHIERAIVKRDLHRFRPPERARVVHDDERRGPGRFANGMPQRTTTPAERHNSAAPPHQMLGPGRERAAPQRVERDFIAKPRPAERERAAVPPSAARPVEPRPQIRELTPRAPASIVPGPRLGERVQPPDARYRGAAPDRRRETAPDRRRDNRPGPALHYERPAMRSSHQPPSARPAVRYERPAMRPVPQTVAPHGPMPEQRHAQTQRRVLPPANVQRPVQQAPLHATPQGWRREPGPRNDANPPRQPNRGNGSDRDRNARGQNDRRGG